MLRSEGMILFIGLAIAFVLVEGRPHIRLFNRKPFNCIKCMSGWCSMGTAWVFDYGYDCFWFFPLGIFVGAMFEGIRMRYF